MWEVRCRVPKSTSFFIPRETNPTIKCLFPEPRLKCHSRVFPSSNNHHPQMRQTRRAPLSCNECSSRKLNAINSIRASHAQKEARHQDAPEKLLARSHDCVRNYSCVILFLLAGLQLIFSGLALKIAIG